MFAVLYCSTSYLSSSATPSIYHHDAKRPQDLEFQLDFLSFDAEAATTCPARMCISIYLDPFCLSKVAKFHVQTATALFVHLADLWVGNSPNRFSYMGLGSENLALLLRSVRC